MVQAAWTVIRSKKLPPDLQKWNQAPDSETGGDGGRGGIGPPAADPGAPPLEERRKPTTPITRWSTQPPAESKKNAGTLFRDRRRTRESACSAKTTPLARLGALILGLHPCASSPGPEHEDKHEGLTANLTSMLLRKRVRELSRYIFALQHDHAQTSRSCSFSRS